MVQAWFHRSRPFPYSREVAGAAMALFYVMGGITILLVLVFPHPSALNEGVLLVLGAPSILIGGGVYLLRRRLPVAALPWLLAVGTIIITLSILLGGSGPVTLAFSFFYLWVVIYALLFLAPMVATLHIGLAAAAYGAALIWLAQPEGGTITAFEPTVVVIVIAVTGGVILWLSRARDRSEIDPLTLAANRRGLDRILDAALQEAEAAREVLVVGIIDVDHFKEVNDVLGHAAGDQLLEELARGWRAALRATDTLGRIGGDEFVVVLPGCSRGDAAPILERLRLAALNLETTCSVGGALLEPEDSASLLLGRADTALYRAKSQAATAWSGRGLPRVPDPAPAGRARGLWVSVPGAPRMALPDRT